MKNIKCKSPLVIFTLVLFSVFTVGCAPVVHVKEKSKGHIGLDEKTNIPTPQQNYAAIPPRVKQSVILPPPKTTAPLEKFTVIVNDVPAKELLFALARDAKMNLDIYDDIEGKITLNAIDQTLPQILDRVGKQSSIRYEIKDGNISVSADTAYLQTYKVDYVNLERKTESNVELNTQITDVQIGEGSSGTANNNSSVTVENKSENVFWQTLFTNISAIIGDADAGKAGTSGNVIVNKETGLISVRASQAQHKDIQAFIDDVLTSARRQVLIEATVVEVTLSDSFQSGIDWSRNPLNPANDFSFSQQLTAGTLGSAPTSVLEVNSQRSDYNILSSVRLLSQFGDVQVLSSPKMMALNNQTALLKVVDNRVYFTVDAQTTITDNIRDTIFESKVHTVPVGLIMAITPFVSDADEVTLNVRPTISRILGFVNDPNPGLANAGVVNPIPEIQVREMESVLRLSDSQIGVIGGLMQDTSRKNTSSVPGVGDVAILGEAFKARDQESTKTELVIFIRPTVVDTASLNGDLQHLRAYLPKLDTYNAPAESN